MHTCAFCSQTEDEARCLVSGALASICDKCIKVCMDVIKDLDDRETGQFYQRAFSTSNDAKDCFSSGQRYLSLKQYEKAIVEFDEAIRLMPHFNAARFNRAMILIKIGKLQAALTDLNCVVHAEPNHSEAFKTRALANLELKLFDRAISDLTEAIRLNAGSVSLHVIRAGALEAKGDLNGAKLDYQAALAVAPQGTEEDLAYDVALERLSVLSSG